MYDGVLRLHVPAEAKIIGFADDVAVVVVAKQLSEVERCAEVTVAAIVDWLTSMGLALAEQKTELLLISKRKIREQAEIRVKGFTVQSKPSLKYLGIKFDSRLKFKDHLDYVCEKAASTQGALSRLMLNTRGPRHNVRKLLAGVLKSVILYGAEVWATACDTPSYIKGIRSVYRLCALRVCSAFRTVSEDAALVISGLDPIDLLVQESSSSISGEPHGKCWKLLARRRTMEQWQHRWDHSNSGRWTHRLIPHIESWLSRKHGEVDFNVTQLLSGHGCFRAYFFRFKLDDAEHCETCGQNSVEDAEHVLLHAQTSRRNESSLAVHLE